MSNPRENPRELLRVLEQGARKRFGQNFLTRGDIVSRMVRGARVTDQDTVVEVGPGLGLLTEALVATKAKLTAIELDRDLASYIDAQFGADLRLIQGDALQQDWAALFPEGGVKMVANLPYNVGTQLLIGVLDLPHIFRSVTVMLQHEVVARCVAVPNTKAYGALSIRCQVRGKARFLLPVPPESFHPAPKVQSAVLHIDLFDAPDIPVPVEAFDRVVKAAFSQRRKTVLNSLGALYGRERTMAALEQAGVDPQLRAEALDLTAFRALAVALEGAVSTS